MARSLITLIVAIVVVSTPVHGAVQILFVVDMSTSMSTPWDGSIRWSAVEDAIVGALNTYGSFADFGLMVFPGAGGGCAEGEIVVDVGPNTAAAIQLWLASATIGDGFASPIGQSLKAASLDPVLAAPLSHNVVVLVVDGSQFCSVEGETRCVTQADCDFMGVSPCPSCLPAPPEYCYCVQDWPVLGAQALRDEGVYSYVIGIDDETIPYWLNQVAFEGGTAIPGCDPFAVTPSCFVQAVTRVELNVALAASIAHAIENGPIFADGFESGDTSVWTGGA